MRHRTYIGNGRCSASSYFFMLPLATNSTHEKTGLCIKSGFSVLNANQLAITEQAVQPEYGYERLRDDPARYMQSERYVCERQKRDDPSCELLADTVQSS